jgi:hypothetical protein
MPCTGLFCLNFWCFSDGSPCNNGLWPDVSICHPLRYTVILTPYLCMLLVVISLLIFCIAYSTVWCYCSCPSAQIWKSLTSSVNLFRSSGLPVLKPSLIIFWYIQ